MVLCLNSFASLDRDPRHVIDDNWEDDDEGGYLEDDEEPEYIEQYEIDEDENFSSEEFALNVGYTYNVAG